MDLAEKMDEINKLTNEKILLQSTSILKIYPYNFNRGNQGSDRAIWTVSQKH